MAGTKVIPPERAIMREMSGSHWAAASRLAEVVGSTTSEVGSRLRRLETLGHVQSMQGVGGKEWRLTAQGVDFKQAHLAGWRPLVGWGQDPRRTSVRKTDGRKIGRVLYPDRGSGSDPSSVARWGVEYADGSFDWEPPSALEVLA